MKIVGINFSSRKNGNCSNSIEYCLKHFNSFGHDVEIVNFFDYDIESCGLCDYQCFPTEKCIKKDDAKLIYEKCIHSDIIILAMPTFRGHLSSSYFVFSERAQGVFNGEFDYKKDYLRKINMIVIGNLSSGADMALHEAFYEFTNQSFFPEAVLLSSRDYGRRSISGDLIEEQLVKLKLDKYVEVINRKFL